MSRRSAFMSLSCLFCLPAAGLAAQAPGRCLDGLAAAVSARTADQDREYLSLTGGAAGIRKGNQARLFRGTRPDRAVLLVHGFIASPFEVLPLAEALNAKGFTVLAPLVPGFGGSDAVANAVPYPRWQAAVDRGVDDLSRCYKEVALVGFSLGGGLVADYVLNRGGASGGRSRVVSIAMLSPYFKTAVLMGGLINGVARTVAKDDTVAFSLLRTASKATGAENRDLMAPMKYPEHYNQAMPRQAVKQILEFSEVLRGVPSDKVLRIPAFLSYTEGDATIDWKAARDLASHHFESLSLFTFSADKKVAHQIALEISGADVPRLAARLAAFVEHGR